MTHWMCTTCGYYFQVPLPPDRCPSCQQVCAFNDVTCYRPECGGVQNIDPLVVSSTLRFLKRGSEPSPGPKSVRPSPKIIPLVQLLAGRSVSDKEELEQLSFWGISQVEILKGLSREQRQQIRGLGRTEHFDPAVGIFTEGEDAHKLYVVEEGRVAVESRVVRGMQLPITIVYRSQAFGWSALVPPYTYTASVTTLSRTRILAIERESLLAMMQSEPSVGFTIMQNIACIVASRLRTLEQELASLLQGQQA